MSDTAANKMLFNANLLTEALRIEREKTARRCAEIGDAAEIRREFGLDQEQVR